MNPVLASVVDFGVLGQWVAVVAILAVGWRISSGGGGAALDALDKSNSVLEKRVGELEKQGKRDAETIAAAQATIAELRGKTDFAIALAPILEWSSSHEQRAQSRHEAALAILQLIADRLGPEPNGKPVTA